MTRTEAIINIIKNKGDCSKVMTCLTCSLSNRTINRCGLGDFNELALRGLIPSRDRGDNTHAYRLRTAKRILRRTL